MKWQNAKKTTTVTAHTHTQNSGPIILFRKGVNFFFMRQCWFHYVFMSAKLLFLVNVLSLASQRKIIDDVDDDGDDNTPKYGKTSNETATKF